MFMDAEIAASITAELDALAASRTADFMRRRAALLATRAELKVRRDAGLRARHAAKIPRQRESSDVPTMR